MRAIYFAQACRNSACELYMAEAPGHLESPCPRCGWLRVLARIRAIHQKLT